MHRTTLRHREHTHFETLQEMFDAGGFQSAEDLQTPEWTELIADQSDFGGWSFGGWSEMLSAAVAGWVKRKMGL